MAPTCMFAKQNRFKDHTLGLYRTMRMVIEMHNIMD